MTKSQISEGDTGWSTCTATFDHPGQDLNEDTEKLVWALVLRAYTGSDTVVFACLNLTEPSSAREPTICRFVLAGNDSLAAAIEHSTFKIGQCDSETVNTLLWLGTPATDIDRQLEAEKLIVCRALVHSNPFYQICH